MRPLSPVISASPAASLWRRCPLLRPEIWRDWLGQAWRRTATRRDEADKKGKSPAVDRVKRARGLAKRNAPEGRGKGARV